MSKLLCSNLESSLIKFRFDLLTAFDALGNICTMFCTFCYFCQSEITFQFINMNDKMINANNNQLINFQGILVFF